MSSTRSIQDIASFTLALKHEETVEMEVPQFLRNLSYRPSIRQAVRALSPRLATRLSKSYYHLARPRDGILRLEVEGVHAEFNVPDRGEFRLLESLDEERHVLEMLMRTLQPGDCFYDIGAGLGVYSVFLAKVVGEQGQVIAFEPEEYTYGRLREHLNLNRLTNVRAFRLALGGETDQGKLFLPDNTGCHPVAPADGKTTAGLARFVVGDQFVTTENSSPPRAVKIDVEGHEYAVLQGLRKTLRQPACTLVCCEIHPQLLPPMVKPEAVLGLLKSLGFSQIDLYPRRTELHAVARRVEVSDNRGG